jgi:hypothetical protein
MEPYVSVVRTSEEARAALGVQSTHSRLQPQLTLSGVGVEKLIQQKMAEKTLHQEALQTTFSVF